MKFILVLALLSVFGFLISLPAQYKGVKEGYNDPYDMVLNSLDLITITVPPALPTALAIGVTFAMARLKKKQIYCISPPKVNICGKVSIMCFDKTGTLTEDDLDMYGIRSCVFQDNKVQFEDIIYEPQSIYTGKKQLSDYFGFGDPKMLLLEIMASCHSLTRVNNQIIGDPLDIKMFQTTNFILEETDPEFLAVIKPDNSEQTLSQKKINNSECCIVRRFEFSSKLQRMSVIVRKKQQNEYRIYTKGSPEVIFELCRKKSIPPSFHYILDYYAQKGFRILALATRLLHEDIKQIKIDSRDEFEQSLVFCGLIIMENKLKPISNQIIDLLNQANIRSIMVTGDNPLTAISVGRQSEIVHENKRVFLGDLDPASTKIIWKDFERSSRTIDLDQKLPEQLSQNSDELDLIDNQQLEKSLSEESEKMESFIVKRRGSFAASQKSFVSHSKAQSEIFMPRKKSSHDQPNIQKKKSSQQYSDDMEMQAGDM